jgi:signal transduction histidine kinase
MSTEGTPSTPSNPSAGPFVDRRKWIHKQLEAVRILSQALSQHVTVDALVAKALETALEVLKAEAGSVLLADPETKQLIFHHSIGASPVPYGTAIPWDKGIAGSVFQSGKPAIINEVKKDTRHYSGIDTSTGFETRNMVTLPLKRWEGEAIGVLNILNKREGGIFDDDVATLTVISAITAAAIEQARLFEEAKLAEVARILGDIGHDIKNMLMPVVMGAGILQSELDDLFTPTPTVPTPVQSPQGRSPKGKTAARSKKKTPAPSPPAAPDEEPDTRKRFLMVIGMLRNSSRRIQDRVKEIADCVKGMSSPPTFLPCKIAGVIASVEDILSLPAQQKNITLRHDGLESLPEILADEQRLYNAFYNLINNAIPEVPEDGSITISGRTELGSGYILVSVSDTGCGMPPEIRDSLFTSRAISRKPGGTGLGTKIVKDVVDAHGGNITVESEEGMGTTFHLRLPIRQPNTQAQKSAPSSSLQSSPT